MLGDERFEQLEPIAKFVDAGAVVAFGSDWPIDDFDEWYDLKWQQHAVAVILMVKSTETG